MNYEKRCNEILEDQSASDWLKRAVLALGKRDPVDAANDADALASLQHARVAELLPEHFERDRIVKLQIGDTVIVRGLECRVFAVHPFGTIDAEEIDGPRAFRLSGLAIEQLAATECARQVALSRGWRIE